MDTRRSTSSSVLVMLVIGLLLAAAAGATWGAAPARAADPPGTLQWTRNWLPKNVEEIFDVELVRARDGDLILAGTAQRLDGDTDFAIARYSPDGTRRWAKVLDTNADHRLLLEGLAVDRAGNAYLAGSAEKTATQWCTMKVGPGGTLLWVRLLSGPAGKGASKDVARAVGCDSRGAVYVAGALGRTGESGDIALVKYSSTGVKRWTRYTGGVGHAFDDPTSLVVDARDHIFVGGMVVGDDADACVLRYTTSGVRRWMRIWDGAFVNDIDRVHDIAVGPTGVAATGTTGDAAGKKGGLVLKLRLSDGADVWAPRIVAYPNVDVVYYAVATNDAGYVAVTGSMYDRLSPSYPDYDYDMTSSLIRDAVSPPETYGTLGAGTAIGRDVVLTRLDWMIGTGSVYWGTGDLTAYTFRFKIGATGGWSEDKEVAGRHVTGERLAVSSGRVFVAGTNGDKLMLLKYVR